MKTDPTTRAAQRIADIIAEETTEHGHVEPNTMERWREIIRGEMGGAGRDEYAERAANPNLDNPAHVAARNCWRYAATITTVEDMAKVIAEAYAPLHEKLARANGMIETMNESMKRLEAEVEDEIQRRDRYHDAITAAHVALGGDGEWRAHVGGGPEPPRSGHLHLDVPVMATELRAELAQTASDRDEWRRLAESYAGDRVGAQQELASVTEERDDATRFLARRGYKRCDIPACNCDSWHGGDFEERFREVADLLDTNGKTPLDAVRELIAERDRLREQIEDRDWARDKD